MTNRFKKALDWVNKQPVNAVNVEIKQALTLAAEAEQRQTKLSETVIHLAARNSEIEDFDFPDVTEIHRSYIDSVQRKGVTLSMILDNRTETYHNDRIVKAKDARISELEAFIEARGYEVPECK